jgi:predicted dithiol-disulfide oxidoreductase (DUF899 family)
VAITKHPVVSGDEWLTARAALLAKEKEYMRQGDQLAAMRRELPWTRIDKPYAFDGPRGRVGLPDLFGPRSQLIVYHFMFAPEWDEGCKHCSFWADNFDGIDVHLAHRDAAFTAVSRAPLAKLDAFKRRMGWRFSWLSSGEGDFTRDLGVFFTPAELAAGDAFYNYKQQDPGISDREGISIFMKGGRDIFHTYSCYARGIEVVNGAYHFMDLLPKGRAEGEDSQAWVRHHDRYED